MDNGQLTFKKEDLLERILDFGVRIIKLVNKLPQTPAGFKLGSQLVGSATSIGANTQEAQDASSKADFISKMNIALREAKESKFWLKLIKKSGLLSNGEVDPELKEADELCAIYSTIVKKAKLNLSNVKSQMSNVSGFTLIELLIAISIMAVLSTIGLNTYRQTQEKARDSIRKSDLTQLATALEAYHQKNGNYLGALSSVNCSTHTNQFYAEIAPYMVNQVAPKDPKTGNNYCYISENNGQSFRLFTKLENCADSQIIPSINCATASYNFSITSDDLLIAVAPTGGETPPPSPTTTPTLIPPPPVSVNDTNYDLGVLVIKYFPIITCSLNPSQQCIDIAVTGDVGDLYDVIKSRTDDVTNQLKISLEKASTYLGYKDPAAKPALRYTIVDTKEYTQAVPIKPRPDKPRYPDYKGIMLSHNICDFVDNKGVREVWLWAYQGPPKTDGHAYLEIYESKMAGPIGDFSNSGRENDMPICANTYRVYTFNYQRFTAEALESWGHQIEAEIDAIDKNLYRDIFQGPNYPQTLGVTGRCGSVHNPPNARFEYDRANPTPQKSDCLDWNPDSLGQLSDISCQIWGCSDINPVSSNAALNYQIWVLQNMPGRNNNKTYQGKKLRNWWDVHGDFENVMINSKRLTIQ